MEPPKEELLLGALFFDLHSIEEDSLAFKMSGDSSLAYPGFRETGRVVSGNKFRRTPHLKEQAEAEDGKKQEQT